MTGDVAGPGRALEGGRTDPGPVPSSVVATSRTLMAGAIASAACLLVAIVLEVLGRPVGPGDPIDVGSVIAAAIELRPWGWATVGIVLLILTPAAGLVATAYELRGSRESWLAAAVLALLALSVAIAAAR